MLPVIADQTVPGTNQASVEQFTSGNQTANRDLNTA